MRITQKLNKTTLLALAFAILLVGSQLLVAKSYQAKVDGLKAEIEKRDLRTELKPAEELRKDYYYTETATLVSPHTMRLKMDNGEVDFVLIDVRAAEDYQRGHIRGAINIPFDGSPATIEKFRQALEEGNKQRRSYAIIYCYSSVCMLGRKTGQELSKHGISVKELGVGYNDWEQQHKVWNNPGEVYDISRYIIRGPEAGELKPSQDFLNRPCSVDEKYSC